METAQSAVTITNTTQADRPQTNAKIIAEVIQQKSDVLLRTLCVYVQRAGLGYGSDGKRVAQDLLGELVVQALRHAERFDPKRQAMAWLLGIANNLILQEKHKRRRQKFREPFLQDMLPKEGKSDVDGLIGRLRPGHLDHAKDVLASRDQYEKMLACVSTQDQKLIHMSVTQQMTAQEIGESLELSAGAVRVRLHRALKRLRAALEENGRDELLAR